MPTGLLTMESVNMVCGDTGNAASPGVSTHLEIIDLKLPNIERNYVDHNPGGAPFQIEVPVFVNKLEATFTLAGWNPVIQGMILRDVPATKRFTAYGLVRERSTNLGLRAMAVFEAQLGRVNPTNFTKGSLQGFEYALRSIVHYELLLQVGRRQADRLEFADGTFEPMGEIYFWDFFTNELRVGGVSVNTEYVQVNTQPGTVI